MNLTLEQFDRGMTIQLIHIERIKSNRGLEVTEADIVEIKERYMRKYQEDEK